MDKKDKNYIDMDKEMGLPRRGRMKVVSERVFIKGEPHYKVLHIEALEARDLPDEYLNNSVKHGWPCCWLEIYYYSEQDDDVDDVKVLEIRTPEDNGEGKYSLVVGGLYPEPEYDRLMSYVEKAGNRLAILLDQWKRRCFVNGRNVWKGTRVDVF